MFFVCLLKICFLATLKVWQSHDFFLLKLKYNMKFNSGRRNKATTKFKNFLMFQTLHCHKKHQPRLTRNKVNVECVNLIFLSNLCRYIKKSSMIRTFYFFNSHTCYFRFIYNIIYISLKTFWIFQHSHHSSNLWHDIVTRNFNLIQTVKHRKTVFVGATTASGSCSETQGYLSSNAEHLYYLSLFLFQSLLWSILLVSPQVSVHFQLVSPALWPVCKCKGSLRFCHISF